jgi:GNAT superfamily N-acetyltransferase
VAEWIFKQWGWHNPANTLQAYEDRFRRDLNRSALPLTLIALYDDLQPVGTARLVFNDLSIRPELSPWLAAVYVIPERRGQGAGSLLVQRAEDVAARLGVPRLYLFTPDQEAFYARLGWVVFENMVFKDDAVVIMHKDLLAAGV